MKSPVQTYNEARCSVIGIFYLGQKVGVMEWVGIECVVLRSSPVGCKFILIVSTTNHRVLASLSRLVKITKGRYYIFLNKDLKIPQ